MRAWFDSLDQRERILVILGALVVAATLYYAILWEPLATGQQRLRTELADARALQVEMRQVQAEANAARRAGGPAVSSGSRSLLAVVDETSKRAGLGDAVKRIQPDGDRSVRLWLEQARFDDLVRWLHELETRHGVLLSNGSLDRDSSGGLVKARITLERAA